MKKTLLLLPLIILALGLLQIPSAVKAQSNTSAYADVDAYMEETLRKYNIDGMALAFVKGDQILYMKGYGLANQAGDLATPQTPWPMGSVTKSFTALAVEQLVQAGKIDLNAPLVTYIPEFRLADEKSSAKITVRQALDHKTGISTEEGTAAYVNKPGMTFDQALKNLSAYKAVNAPGEMFEYSNWNYVLLGKIIEKVSGKTYGEYMHQNIFIPLEMSRSTFDDFHSIPQAASGKLISFGFSIPYNEPYQPLIMGAGFLTSTAEDMAHYLIAFTGNGSYNGKTVLGSKTRGWYDPWWNWNSGYPSSDTFYGFSGGMNSFSTTCLLAPSDGYGLVLLVNTRLDEINASKDSYSIAVDVINIAVNHTSRSVSSTLYYGVWVLVDVIFIGLFFSVIWQVLRIKKWKRKMESDMIKSKVWGWISILFDLLVSAALFYFPRVMNTRWDSALSYRPDFSLPLLLIAISLGVIGIVKIGIILAKTRNPNKSAVY